MFRPYSAIIRLKKQWSWSRYIQWFLPDDGRLKPKHVAKLNVCNNLQLLFILLYKDGFNLYIVYAYTMGWRLSDLMGFSVLQQKTKQNNNNNNNNNKNNSNNIATFVIKFSPCSECFVLSSG